MLSGFVADSVGSRSSVCSILDKRETLFNMRFLKVFLVTYLNMSMVSSENFACSQAEPTMSISCRLRVMWGDLSHGGVVSGDNLEPEPLHISCCSCAGPQANCGGPCFHRRIENVAH